MARLLNVYQLWLDDLYPRAKFADGLAIIEKLGHKKRIQIMRREWINEGKPRESLDSLGEGAGKPAKSVDDKSWEANLRERPRTPVTAVGDSHDLYAATPKSIRDDRTTKRNGDTEVLVLEHSTTPVLKLGQKIGSPTRDMNSDDDEDALSALNNVW